MRQSSIQKSRFLCGASQHVSRIFQHSNHADSLVNSLKSSSSSREPDSPSSRWVPPVAIAAFMTVAKLMLHLLTNGQ